VRSQFAFAIASIWSAANCLFFETRIYPIITLLSFSSGDIVALIVHELIIGGKFADVDFQMGIPTAF
jgi:hypothetical protein